MQHSLKSLSRSLGCSESRLDQFIRELSFPAGVDIVEQHFDIAVGKKCIGSYRANLSGDYIDLKVANINELRATFEKWTRMQPR